MGRHALLEKPALELPDDEVTVPALRPVELPLPPTTSGHRSTSETALAAAPVRSVAEIIAAFRQESATGGVPVTAGSSRHAQPASESMSQSMSQSQSVSQSVSRPLLQPGPAAGSDPAAAVPLAPRSGRRRAGSGTGTAAELIAQLTAELAGTHPGLLEGLPHQHRPTRRDTAAHRQHTPTPTAEVPAALAPARSTSARAVGALRLAALRVPGVTGVIGAAGTAGGWRVPARTPLLLAGAVAVSVVITDQTGVLSTGNDVEIAQAATTSQVTDAAVATAQDRRAQQARARVSRQQRAEVRPQSAAAVPAGSGGTVLSSPAPPPDSVMKPGQTVPGDWVRPSAKGVYNSCFCSRWGTMHEGIDFAAPLGSPIYAVGDGVVVQAGPASGFGNWVIIRHDNGDMTIYGHMRYYYVTVGQKVTAGQEIALVGAEGQSTGPHLHLGVKINSTDGHDGTYIDPVPWLVARGVAVGTYNQNG